MSRIKARGNATHKNAFRRNVGSQPQLPFVMRHYTDDEMLERIKFCAQDELKVAKEQINKLIADLQEDPARALEWAADHYEHAAKVKMASTVLEYLELFQKQNAENMYETKTARKQLEIMHKDFHAEVMRRAKWPEHSTSPSHNQMALCLNARRAEWVEKLEECIARIGTEYKHYLPAEAKANAEPDVAKCM